MDKPRLVLIADRLFTDDMDANFNCCNLEQISDKYFYDVYNALDAISSGITHYNSPEELIDNIKKHKDDIIFTIYGGEKSRNRMALIPSICESYGIKFCGADSYARVLCQDKYMSKLYCNDFGLKSARGYLIRSVDEIHLLEDLKFPLVLKPNMEGSSIGITENSIVFNSNDAAALAVKLLQAHAQPVLAEEFIEGREICFYIIGDSDSLDLFSALEIYFQKDELYFEKHLFCANLKHQSDDLAYRSVLEDLPAAEVNKIKAIFSSLGKMDYMRIDCRLKDNELYLIELTPDAHIGGGSGFSYLAKRNKIAYSDIFLSIIRTALKYYQLQGSNLK